MTNILHSNYTDIGSMMFPGYSGRQQYMHDFDIANPEMPSGFEDYGSVVGALCAAAGYHKGIAHMTVDEKIVRAGWSQRRPDAHVDGHYMDGRWGHPGPAWMHGVERMAVIVAASVPGCIGYEGVFHGTPKDDGDLEHIRDQFDDGELLPANRAFLLSPDCVHESIRFSEPTQRSFLRIALPVN